MSSRTEPPPAKKKRIPTADLEAVGSTNLFSDFATESEVIPPQDNIHIGYNGFEVVITGPVKLVKVVKPGSVTEYHFPEPTIFNGKTTITLEEVEFCDSRGYLITKNARIILPGTFTHCSIINTYWNVNYTARIIFPSSLRELNIRADEFDHPMDELPPITKLYCNTHISTSLEGLPDTIENMSITGHTIEPTKYPENLKHLITNFYDSSSYSIEGLPEGLETLHLAGGFDLELIPGTLPVTLTYFTIGDEDHREYNHPISGRLPDGLEVLDLSLLEDWDYPVDGLPVGLEEFIASEAFNHPIEPLAVLPNLISLHLGDRFNQPITRLPNLKYLVFGEDFTHNIPREVYPESLRKIRFSKKFQHDLSEVADTVTHIRLDSSYSCRITRLPVDLKFILVSSSYPYLQELIDMAGKDKVLLEDLKYVHTEADYENYKIISREMKELEVNSGFDPEWIYELD